MRSAVDQILKFNRSFHRPSLALKLQKMLSSPFVFFRGTYHLFARDVLDGPFRRVPLTRASGSIVGDLHTENFGTFRSVNGEIEYDINDFDETTDGPYEMDLRRMSTALMLAALDTGHAYGEGISLAETFTRAYLKTLAQRGKLTTRAAFEKLHNSGEIRRVLSLAAEKSRVEMFLSLAVEAEPGHFVLRANPQVFQPASEAQREHAVAALPQFLETCLRPAKAKTGQFRLHHLVFRFAGCGSLGRERYALLLSKGQRRATWKSLRLVEWKDALDSALYARRPMQSKGRAREVVTRTIAFQLFPKRYLGYTRVEGRPMQTREIGANDARFPHREFTDAERFHRAATIFGRITARDHLLASLGKRGPRGLLTEIAGQEDRFVYRQLAFAAAYTDQTLDDFQELQRRHAEVAKAWKVK